jgi:hypothetical protein
MTADEVLALCDAWQELHDYRLLSRADSDAETLARFEAAHEAGKAFTEAIRQLAAERDAALARVTELEAQG